MDGLLGVAAPPATPEAERLGSGLRAAATGYADLFPTLCDVLALEPPDGLEGASWLDASATTDGVYGETYYPMIHYGWSPLLSWRDARLDLRRGTESRAVRPHDRPRRDADVHRVAPRDRGADVAARRVRRARSRSPGLLDSSMPARASRCSHSATCRAAAGAVDRTRDPKQLIDVAALIFNAMQFLHDDRAAAAQELLQRAYRLDPRNATVLYQLGESLRRQGDSASAAAYYRSAVDRNPGMAEAWSHLALVAFDQGNRGRAFDLLDEGLQHAPDAPPLLLARGDLRLETGDLGAAAKDYRRLAATPQPDSPDPLGGPRPPGRSDGDRPEADRLWARVYELAPSTRDCLVALEAGATHRLRDRPHDLETAPKGRSLGGFPGVGVATRRSTPSGGPAAFWRRRRSPALTDGGVLPILPSTDPRAPRSDERPRVPMPERTGVRPRRRRAASPRSSPCRGLPCEPPPPLRSGSPSPSPAVPVRARRPSMSADPPRIRDPRPRRRGRASRRGPDRLHGRRAGLGARRPRRGREPVRRLPRDPALRGRLGGVHRRPGPRGRDPPGEVRLLPGTHRRAADRIARDDPRRGGRRWRRRIPPGRWSTAASSPCGTPTSTAGYATSPARAATVFHGGSTGAPATRPSSSPCSPGTGCRPSSTYHAMIESGFNPGAYSWAHAVGTVAVRPHHRAQLRPARRLVGGRAARSRALDGGGGPLPQGAPRGVRRLGAGARRLQRRRGARPPPDPAAEHAGLLEAPPAARDPEPHPEVLRRRDPRRRSRGLRLHARPRIRRPPRRR